MQSEYEMWCAERAKVAQRRERGRRVARLGPVADALIQVALMTAVLVGVFLWRR